MLFTLDGAIILNLLHDLFFLREKQEHKEMITRLRREEAENDLPRMSKVR